MAAPGLTPAQAGQCPQNTQAILLPSKQKWLVVLGLTAHNVPFPNQRRSGTSAAAHSVERTRQGLHVTRGKTTMSMAQSTAQQSTQGWP